MNRHMVDLPGGGLSCGSESLRLSSDVIEKG